MLVYFKSRMVAAWVLVVIVGCLSACGVGGGAGSSSESFGQPITLEGARPVAAVYEAIKTSPNGRTETLKLEGSVAACCQASGCWLKLQAGEGLEPIHVTFKDYGFFVPKDIAGKRVVVEGFAYTDTTTVEALRHIAEDAGQSAAEIAAITSPLVEVKFEASGVRIVQ